MKVYNNYKMDDQSYEQKPRFMTPDGKRPLTKSMLKSPESKQKKI